MKKIKVDEINLLIKINENFLKSKNIMGKF